MRLSEIARMLLGEDTSSRKGVFYHGSKNKISQKDLKPEVMYFTDDYDEAVGYSTNRHGISNPIVISAKLIMRRTLRDEEVLHSVVKSMGYDTDEYSSAEWIEQPKVVDGLKKLGYDSAVFPDFGFLSDFNQFDAYIVFDAKKQVKII